MPKPYKGKTRAYGTPFAALERPELGALIASIASLGAVIEREMAGLLGDLLESPSKQTLAMYLALSGSQARKSALLAAAKLRISKGDYEVLVKLYKKIGNTVGERNDVVHGMWCLSDDYPNDLVLCDPSDFVHYERSSSTWRDTTSTYSQQTQT